MSLFIDQNRKCETMIPNLTNGLQEPEDKSNVHSLGLFAGLEFFYWYGPFLHSLEDHPEGQYHLQIGLKKPQNCRDRNCRYRNCRDRRLALRERFGFGLLSMIS